MRPMQLLVPCRPRSGRRRRLLLHPIPPLRACALMALVAGFRAGPTCAGEGEVEGVPGSTATVLCVVFSWCSGGAPLPSRGLLLRSEVCQVLDFEVMAECLAPGENLAKTYVDASNGSAIWRRSPPWGVAEEFSSLKIPRVRFLRV
ncbi:hypothetical protein VPH35_113829 [Triticum aestivum]